MLIIFSAIGYLEYALRAFFGGIVIDYSYNRYDIVVSPVGVILRFGKELMVILLVIQILYYLYRNRSIMKLKSIRSIPYILVVLFIVLEGIVSGRVSCNSSIMLFVSGMRGIVYLSIGVIIALEFNSKEFYLKVCKTLDYIFIFQFVLIILQAIQLAMQFGVNLLVEMRVCGTFGHTVNLAAFLLAYSLNNFIMSYILKARSEKKGVLINVLCSISIIISGSRTAMIISAILILVMIFISVTKKYDKYYNKIDLGSLVFIAAVFSLLVKGIEILSGRGSILQVNMESGRIKILIDYLTKSPIGNVLFGSGIGYGTNTGVLLQETETFSSINADIMDGTITTFITQFGVVTLIFVFIAFILFIKWFINNNYKFRVITWALMVIFIGLMMLNGNILEQYSFIIILVYSIISIKIIYEESKINDN